MTDFCIYGGIACIIVGCIIMIIGAANYWRQLKTQPATPLRQQEYRAQLKRTKLIWIILSLIGAALSFIPAFLS